MNQDQVNTAARLEGTYGVMRKIQATHDTFETRCIGSGNCCRIGLVIPLVECWNIARNLRADYWKHAESEGYEIAQDWFDNMVGRLKAKMYDESWEPKSNENDTHCAFFNHEFSGCEVYEYRPFVCRAYGVIVPVQDGVCPRKRLPDGRHELIRDDTVRNIINEFDAVVESWGTAHPELNFSIYMPAGVLRFLLPDAEVRELIQNTDPKFWMGHEGYQHMMAEETWQSVEIKLGEKNNGN